MISLKKRMTCLILASGMMLGAFAGCGKKEEPKNTEPTPSASQNADKSAKTGLPLAEKLTELSIWTAKDQNYRKSDYNEKPSFQKMQEMTNVKIKWELVTGTNGTELFTLMMNSGQVPDMILSSVWNQEASKYGAKGTLLQLDKYIDSCAPNLKKIFEQYPDVRKQITGPDGHIYYFPNLGLDTASSVQLFPQIRADWLKKLNLKEPETIDDWYTVLKAFKTQDPNGNGKDDEIPLVTTGLKRAMDLFIGAFGVQTQFYVDNGKVKYGPLEPGYKEAVAFFHKLYSEKLLDPNYLTDKTNQTLVEKITTDRAGAYSGNTGGNMTTFIDMMAQQNHPTFDLIGVPPPKGPKGDRLLTTVGWPVRAYGLAVSAQTKNPELVVKWLDFQYSEEGMLLNNFGVEGVSYDMVNGQPVFKDVVLNNPNGLSRVESLLTYTIGGGSWATVEDPRYNEQYASKKAMDERKKVVPYVDMNKMLPPLGFLKEEQDIITPVMADVNPYKDEKENAIIMGKIPLSKYDEEFLEGIKKLKMEKVVEIYQKAYDRYKNLK